MTDDGAVGTNILRCMWFYMSDGTVKFYDLSDPKIPLPRFLALVPA